MRRLVFALAFLITPLNAQPGAQVFRLESTRGLKAVNVKLDAAEFSGRKAVHAQAETNRNGMAVMAFRFHSGTIELDVAGQPAPGSDSSARGFIGLAFRVSGDETHYECFYLRPTNGRADDPIRRSHAVQYEAEPDYPWDRLRKENPGQYESAADIQPGVWTKMKIVVEGRKARLFVNGAERPCLIVDELKHGVGDGGLALWVGPGTDGYFSNLRVKGVR